MELNMLLTFLLKIVIDNHICLLNFCFVIEMILYLITYCSLVRQ